MIIRKIKKKILNYFAGLLRPQIVRGFRRSDGVRMKTYISSSTFIDYPENLFVEENVYIGHFNFIEASNKIILREGVQITNYVTVTTHSSHISIRLYGRNYNQVPDMAGYKKGPVEIGAYSFIGPYTVLMPGTKIGKGSLVSSHSFVKGAFPDFSVIAGNPAVVIGDTRDIDKPYLEKNPELKKFYEQWTSS
jgi:acetyltransferase-like isoleucine patch superfamily enzyme